jgi:response regulator RpfG family c-di-GMP phosphodiesterase
MKLKVLFLDDDNLSHICLRMAMDSNRYPFQIDMYKEPVDAIKMIKSKDYDCIITDFDMPQLTGIEFVFVMNSLDKPVPPIIGYTGVKDPEDAFKHHPYVKKIFSKTKLKECLEYIYLHIYTEVRRCKSSSASI